MASPVPTPTLALAAAIVAGLTEQLRADPDVVPADVAEHAADLALLVATVRSACRQLEASVHRCRTQRLSVDDLGADVDPTVALVTSGEELVLAQHVAHQLHDHLAIVAGLTSHVASDTRGD